ncbi:Colicin V production protein [Streptococcus sp. DD10]|nr:Colicin V production protein [Streptococcus sp. DD10]
MQSFYVIGALVAIFLASTYFRNFTRILSLWIPYSSPSEGATVLYYPSNQIFELDKVFYAGLSYLFVFFIVYVLFRLIGILVHLFPTFFEDKVWANLLGGFLSVIVTALVLQMLLIVLSTVPLDVIQNRLNSAIPRFLIQAPITSDLFKSLWFSQITG